MQRRGGGGICRGEEEEGYAEEEYAEESSLVRSCIIV
jgi:hypothetical protein